MISVLLLAVMYSSVDGQEWLTREVCFPVNVTWNQNRDTHAWVAYHSLYSSIYPPQNMETNLECALSEEYLIFKPTIDYIIPRYWDYYCLDETSCPRHSECKCCTMPSFDKLCYSSQILSSKTQISCDRRNNTCAINIQPEYNITSCGADSVPDYSCKEDLGNGFTYYKCVARWAWIYYKCLQHTSVTLALTTSTTSLSTTIFSTSTSTTQPTTTLSLTLSPPDNNSSTSPSLSGLVMGLIVAAAILVLICAILFIICFVKFRKKARNKKDTTRHETPYEDVSNESELTPIAEQTAQNTQHTKSSSQNHYVPDEEEYAVIDKTKKKKNIKQKKSNFGAKNENSGTEYYNMVNIVPRSQANNSMDYEDTSITVQQDNKPNTSNPTKGNNNNMVENTYYESQDVNKDRLLSTNQANDDGMMENPYYESPNVNKDRLVSENQANDDAMMENPYYEGQQ